jgi:hypothetical protein
MANQAYIEAHEKEVIAAIQSVKNAVEAYQMECQLENSSHGYKQNHDYWGTFRLNLQSLQRQINTFLDVSQNEFEA